MAKPTEDDWAKAEMLSDIRDWSKRTIAIAHALANTRAEGTVPHKLVTEAPEISQAPRNTDWTHREIKTMSDVA